jgi:hypothetical protein
MMSDSARTASRGVPRAASRRHSRSARGLAGLSAAAAAAACLLAVAPPAAAASPPISNPRIIVHLDFSRGQTPENLALEPDGSADVTFAEAAQVARVSPDDQVRILAQLPEPAEGAACPVLGPLLRAPALTVGIVRDHAGSLYVALCTGSPDQQGIWRVSPDGSASRIAALPADGIPNGMALDQRHGFIYVADSLLSQFGRDLVRGEGRHHASLLTGHGGRVDDAVEVLATDVARGQSGLAERGAVVVCLVSDG